MKQRIKGWCNAHKLHKYMITDEYSMVSVKTLTASSAERLRVTTNLEVIAL